MKRTCQRQAAFFRHAIHSYQISKSRAKGKDHETPLCFAFTIQRPKKETQSSVRPSTFLLRRTYGEGSQLEKSVRGIPSGVRPSSGRKFTRETCRKFPRTGRGKETRWNGSKRIQREPTCCPVHLRAFTRACVSVCLCLYTQGHERTMKLARRWIVVGNVCEARPARIAIDRTLSAVSSYRCTGYTARPASSPYCAGASSGMHRNCTLKVGRHTHKHTRARARAHRAYSRCIHSVAWSSRLLRLSRFCTRDWLMQETFVMGNGIFLRTTMVSFLLIRTKHGRIQETVFPLSFFSSVTRAFNVLLPRAE